MNANKLLWGVFSVFCCVILFQSYVFYTIDSEVTAMVTEGQVSVSIQFTDTHPPTVTILLPPAGSTFSQNDTVTVQVRALDDDAIASVVANITLPDNSRVEVTLTDAESDGVFEGTFSQTIFGGTYTLRAVATDVNGFVNRNETVQFTVIGPAPPAVAGAGGGGSTSATTGPKLTPVVPTKEVPAPVQFKFKPSRLTRPKSLKPTVEQPVSIKEIPAKIFTLMKSLPVLAAENFSVVTGVLTLTVVNALIALYLISFAVVQLVQQYVNARKSSKKNKNPNHPKE
ncbi:MAG: hypothetical protein HY363_01500 [Candidatus Aenigmarchaeota archaeon]|nr:hypothetical protein [Candidatus Aenigmarchaeota archaeon]